MKKILSILLATQFALAAQLTPIYGVNVIEDNDVCSMVNQKKTRVTKDILGNITIEDEDGNRTRITKDILDNITIEDNEGNRIDVAKDILDNLTIDDE